MKKVHLISILIFIAIFCGCKKYESTMLSEGNPPPPPYTPDNSWVGDGPFYAKANANTLMLLFCNDYIDNANGAPFFEYKIGNGPWSTQIMQSTPWMGYSNWGSSTIPVSIITPETDLIYIRFGAGSTYANIQTSMFNVNGIITFGLPQIEY